MDNNTEPFQLATIADFMEKLFLNILENTILLRKIHQIRGLEKLE